MLRFLRRVWFRLPLDGSGCIPLGPRRARLVQRVASQGFPYGIPVIVAARLLWLIACPVWAVMLSSFPEMWACVSAGWFRGKHPRDTLLHRALARGDAERLRLARDIPGDRQGTLLLSALGRKQDVNLASDKLATAERLSAMELPVPDLAAIVKKGETPLMDEPPWTERNKLLVKPRHGSQAKGLLSVQPLGSASFYVDGNSVVGKAELARRLTSAAGTDDILVQPYLGVSNELRDLSPGAPTVIRAFAMRDRPDAPAMVVSAMLKILPPGNDAPRGIAGLLLIPIDVESGKLENGILLDRPGERFPNLPWGNLLVAGRTLEQWPLILDMVIGASEIFPGTPVIGWDILLGPQGPVILEANTGVSLFRSMLWHFEAGISSPVGAVVEQWCAHKLG